MRADYPFQRTAEHGGKVLVGEEDQTVDGKSYGAFPHLLHDDPVGFIGAFERVDPVALRTRGNDCVYLAAPERTQSFFGFI